MNIQHFVEEVNRINPHFLASLSKKLQAVPPLSVGMMGQSREAKNAEFNATIGSSMLNGKFWALDGLDGYLPAAGIPYGNIYGDEFVESWNRFISAFCENPQGIDEVGPQNGFPTHGIAEGLDLMAGAHLNPGDPVILPDQTWPNINNLFVRWIQAKPYTFGFYDSGTFNVDGLACQLKKAADEGHDKAVVYLNSPSNPNGYVYGKADMAALRDVFKEAGTHMTVVVFCDEAYMSLSFGDDGHRGPLAEHLYGLGDRVFVYSFTGASKILQLFGVRAGFVSLWHQTSELWPYVQQKLLWLARTKRSFANNTTMHLLKQIVDEKQDLMEVIADRNRIFEQRYHACWKAANHYAAQGKWQVYPGGGGYFILLNVGDGQAENFRLKALEKGIGLIRQGESNIRVAFSALEAGDMDEVFGRLASVKG